MFPKNRFARKLLKSAAIFLLITGILVGLFIWRIKVPAPEVDTSKTPDQYKREVVGPDHYRVGKNWLRKNKDGIWEMYLEGAPYERGLVYGVLARELMEKQEVHFVDQIREMIPSQTFLQVLKVFVGWFNRDIYKYIPEENQAEIYGISQSFSDRFDFIGPKYYRILNYHAAHDIGHALTDMNMVACTSFAVNNKLSADSTLLIGRNFDFYVGDAFAETKLIIFMKPDKGYGFASYAWAGFTGVVSGMNEKGITVTLNASKSDIPYGAREPISILAREILQYAATIEEARAIAARRETFVSESLLIGSAEDKRAALIEKSPSKMDLYDPRQDFLVCANHYQSNAFVGDEVNVNNIKDTDSKYRFDRMNELMQQKYPIGATDAVGILRDKSGLNGKFIGYGNAKSLNQLIAHHSVLFKPEQHRMWISTPPYQLGAFICYDLTNVFGSAGNFQAVDSLRIAPDPFMQTNDFKKFEAFRHTRQQINKFVLVGTPLEWSQEKENAFIDENPRSFLTYLALGDYYHELKNYPKAIAYYKQSLQQEVSSANERRVIEGKVRDAEKKSR